MSLEVGFSSAHGGEIHTSYKCSCCLRFLGDQIIRNGEVVVDETAEWCFCHFCGRPLDTVPPINF